MISRSHLSTLVYIAFALWAVILTLRGVSLPTQWRDPLPWVITGLLGVVWCFDQWLWRLPLVRAWFGSPPNLRGFGGVILSGRGRRPTTLQGQYWTDRDTRGELHMTSRNRRLLNDFASASGVKYR